jgi:Tyrosyl-DNA phosphodiesterase
MMYIQDFPRLANPKTGSLSQFANDLILFIKAQNLPSHVIDKVREYDFERSEDIQFVHSISGDHLHDIERHGKNGLAAAIQRLDLKPTQDEMLQLCYVVRNPILTAESIDRRQLTTSINVRLHH